MFASTATFNHAGDGIVLTHQSEHIIRILDYPDLAVLHNTPAHVGGCVAAALDPRGRYGHNRSGIHSELMKIYPRRYLASGGNDSIVNLFDLSEWICARTITACEYVARRPGHNHKHGYWY